MRQIDPEKIRSLAEDYYRSGSFFCSEAIVKAIKDEFELPFPDSVIALASGFPIGIGGSGCTCGAVSGGVMALGMVFGRSQPADPKVTRMLSLAKELHDFFQQRHTCLCCRVLTSGVEFGTPERKAKCVALTGEVALQVANMIEREMTVERAE